MCVDVVRGGDLATRFRLPDTIPGLPVPAPLVFVAVALVGGRALVLEVLFITLPLPVWVGEVGVDMELLFTPLNLESSWAVATI